MVHRSTKGNEYVAILTVNHVTGEVTEFETIDIAHALSGRIKKDGGSPLTLSHEVHPNGDPLLNTSPVYEVSIANLLQIVNSTHRSILPESVLREMNETRPENRYYSDSAVFLERPVKNGASLNSEHRGMVLLHPSPCVLAGL